VLAFWRIADIADAAAFGGHDSACGPRSSRLAGRYGRRSVGGGAGVFPMPRAKSLPVWPPM
jgi:hypothetical protein